MNAPERPFIEYWTTGCDCCDPEWERAYARFETPEQERAKFVRRHKAMGIDKLPRATRIAELFCGRGNGLHALESLGFHDLSGVDLSPSLLGQYRGSAKLYVGDCRSLRFPDASFDLAIVQGGLHHLPKLPEDLDSCLGEIRRILAPGGMAALVEPCATPFLHLAHACMRNGILRRVYPKLDALNAMTEREKDSYFAWLARMDENRRLARAHFHPLVDRATMGKWYFLGRAD
jgi:ubiquinone/menaquinone biosynthesis C-methylase UbiE